MFRSLVDSLDDIFVGRKEELQSLESKWNHLLKKKQHKVHVLLNSPGVGKTALLEQFGSNLIASQDAIYVHVMCKTSDLTRKRIIENILVEIREWFDFSELKEKLTKDEHFKRRIEDYRAGRLGIDNSLTQHPLPLEPS